MRICHLSISLNTGGLERILAGIAAHSDPGVSHQDFIALQEMGRFADEIRESGAHVESIGSTNRWQMVKRLIAIFRKNRYDVVHTHNAYPHIYGTLAARIAGIPVIVNTRHGQRIGYGWKSKLWVRLASRWAHCMVAVSDDAAELSIREDGLPRNKVHRIWNGIDLSEFVYRGSTGQLVAISIGRLAPEKDFRTLICAVSIVLQRVPQLQLKIVGEGRLRSSLEELVKQLGLTRHIEFLGEREDILDLLSASGFYISSSLSEGISLTILEAMAVGLPVVATRVGGNAEIVQDPLTGILAPATNPSELADAIVRMCNMRADWEVMGKAGRQHVIDYFDVRQMVNNYQSLYRELLSRRTT